MGVFCFLSRTLHAWPEKEKHRNPFNWQRYILILYLNLSRHIMLQVYCCYDPTSFTQCTLPVAVKYLTASLIKENKHTRTLIYFTASKFKMHSESFSRDFKKQLLRGEITKVVIFSLLLFFYNWELGGKNIMFLYIFSPQCNLQGLLIYTISLL